MPRLNEELPHGGVTGNLTCVGQGPLWRCFYDEKEEEYTDAFTCPLGHGPLRPRNGKATINLICVNEK